MEVYNSFLLYVHVQVEILKQEFIFRVSHIEQIVEVYNQRLDRWETEALKDWVKIVL
jgi:hypothetical protein